MVVKPRIVARIRVVAPQGCQVEDPSPVGPVFGLLKRGWWRVVEGDVVAVSVR